MTTKRTSFLLATLLASAWACTGSDPDAAVPPATSPEAGAEPPVDAGPGPTDAGADVLAADADAGPIQVTGKLFSRGFDVGLAADYRIAGGATGTSADGGTFAFGTTAPYSVTFAHDDAQGGRTFDVFEGLTTPAPVLESGRYDGRPAMTAHLKGTLTGLGATVPAGSVVRVFARSVNNGVAPTNLVAGDAMTFDVVPNWKGEPSREVTVRAIAYETSTGYPTAFTGYGEAKVTVQDGDILDSVNIALTAPATRTVTGTLTPAGFTGKLYTDLIWLPRDTIGGEYAWDVPAQASFSLLVPVLPGATPRIVAYGNSGSNFTTLGASNAITLDVPSAPTLVAPAEMATLTSGTTFSWTAPPGATGIYRFSIEGPTDAAWIYVWTKGTSVTLPADFRPASGNRAWYVHYYANVPSVDALASGGLGDPGGFVSVGRTIVVP